MFLLVAVLIILGALALSGISFFAWMSTQCYQASKYRQIKNFEEFKKRHAGIAPINKVPQGFEITFKMGRVVKSTIIVVDTEAQALAEFARSKTSYSSIVSVLDLNKRLTP